MIEIPEAIVLSKQFNEHLSGRVIKEVVANQSPHKFAWFYEDPDAYHNRLVGQKIGNAVSVGGFLKVGCEKSTLLFAEGIKFTFVIAGEKHPKKHQLMIAFEDDTALFASIQMYGGIWCYDEEPENIYFEQAKIKPSPLTDEFTFDYFTKILLAEEVIKKSVKAALATEQRIPGLGNGVLQDILFNAKIHPKRKVNTLSESEMNMLFNAIKQTLHEMVIKGGRDVEKDLFGCSGGYHTKMSKLTVGKPCDVCGNPVEKMSYMGGSVYVCNSCQPL